MNYAICILFGIIALITCYVTLDKRYADRVPFLHTERAEKSMDLNRAKHVIFLAVLISIIFCEVRIIRDGFSIFDMIKINLSMICLVGAGGIDLREERIPNFFPALLAFSAVVINIISYFTLESAFEYITSSVFATVVSALGLAMVYLLSRRGIGLGDIKIICALAMMCGVYVLFGTILFGIVSAGLAAIIMLIIKKKTLQEAMPFGPYIYIGFAITIIFTNI